MQHFESINPATEEIEATLDGHTAEDIERALEASWSTFQHWRTTSFDDRAGKMRAAAEYLRTNKKRLGGLITAEMGKPIGESIAEIEKCAMCCDYYAEHAGDFLANRSSPSSATKSYVAYDPLGPVLAVMPWNFPFWQAIRFAAPALMAGNTGVLKHASNVPRCAVALEAVFHQAGFPAGAFQNLLVKSDVIEGVIADKRIRAVTLTGSEGAGSSVAAAAGKAIKKTVLELGGSDPFIVLEDADLELAAETAVHARFRNAGQSCIAGKRFIVAEGVAGEFTDRFVEKVREQTVGDPTNPATTIGPLARKDLVDALDQQLQRSIRNGATVRVGGKRMDGKGFFFEPTVLDGVSNDMPAFCEETFGPMAAVIHARDSDHAVALANESDYGLGASIWTRDTERGERLARDIESGSVFINGMVASDPRLPFGGIKLSGYGRELSDHGIREFVNVKTVWVGPSRE